MPLSPMSPMSQQTVEPQFPRMKKSQVVLIMGAGESGKTTVIKQLTRLYGEGFDERKRQEFIPIISANIIESIQLLINTIEGQVEGELRDVWLEVANLPKSPSCISEDEAMQIARVWSDPRVRAVHAAGWRALGITENAHYFLDKVGVVAAPGYLPCDQDIVNARLMTTAITHFSLSIEEQPFTLFDMGGQRNFRQDWQTCFDGATMLFFVASLSGYNQMLREDAETNRLTESLNMFREVCASDRFKALPKILLLNKDDLFQASLPTTPLTVCFDDYFGDGSISDSRAFVRGKFMDAAPADSALNVFPFFVTATSNESFDRTFPGVCNALFKRREFSPANLRAQARAAKDGSQLDWTERRAPREAGAVLDYWLCYEGFPVDKAVWRWARGIDCDLADPAAGANAEESKERGAAQAAPEPEPDTDIPKRFRDLMTRAAVGELEDWMESENGALALLLLKLEFPRRAFRGQAERMYAQHSAATFRQALRACSPRQPRQLAHMPVAVQLWLCIMLGYAEEHTLVLRAQKSFFALLTQPYWSAEDSGEADRRFLSHVGQQFAQRSMLLNVFMRYPQRNVACQRAFTWTEKQYYAVESEAGSLMQFQTEAHPTLRCPADIQEERYTPQYERDNPPQPSVFLDYWFGKKLTYERIPMNTKRAIWFLPNKHRDNYIREQMTPLYELSLTGALDFWQDTPPGTVAFHILRTNLARSIHRGQPQMFAHDVQAVDGMRELFYRETPDVGGTVFENMKVAHQFWVATIVSYSERGVGDFDDISLPYYDFVLRKPYWNVLPIEQLAVGFGEKMVQRKRELVARFGRLVYKNFILGRPLTAEEEAYYAEGIAQGTLKPFEKVLPEHKVAAGANFDIHAENRKLAKQQAEKQQGGKK